MNEADVVLSAFQQSDGSIKNRPAVLLRVMPPFGDFLVCGISRQLRHKVAGFDDVVQFTDHDFKASGLNGESLIRLGFVAVLSPSDVLGKIGSISSQRHERLLKRLAEHLLRGTQSAS